MLTNKGFKTDKISFVTLFSCFSNLFLAMFIYLCKNFKYTKY